jgi:mannose-6-phosphate isomerase-like protein (cupin superfamily)
MTNAPHRQNNKLQLKINITMKRKIKRMLLWFFAAVGIYIAAGLIIHHWIVPVQKPDFAGYFTPGKSFSSKLEGITQTVVSTDGGYVNTAIVIAPKAAGPVAHAHEHFEEVFTVKSGELSVLIGTEIKKIPAGETIKIPPNTVHKPFNETDSAVTITCRMPLSFAFCLSQVYPFWDAAEKNTKPPAVLFQLAVYGNDFDSYPAEKAPPRGLLKFLKFMLAPTARLLGYRYYTI